MARELPFLERNMRRTRVYCGRAMSTVRGRGAGQRIVFMHMPKCGGTSVSEALYASIPLNERVGVIDAVSTRRATAMAKSGTDDPWMYHEDLGRGTSVFALRESMALQHVAWGTALIHGHVLFTEALERFTDESYRMVTLLRHPVARMVSNYQMACRAGIVQGDAECYLNSDLARRHARVFLRYLSGNCEAPDTSAALDTARRRLSRFEVIGFLDDLPGFQRDFHSHFGVPLTIRKYNDAPRGAAPFSQDQMHRIETLCAADIDIYTHARTLSAQRDRAGTA